MKKVVLSFLFLIFLLYLPFIPCIFPESEPSTKENEIRLEIKYESMGDGWGIASSQEYVKKFIEENKIDNVSSEEITLKGNTMDKKLSFFSKGVPSPKFIVYGNFSTEINDFDDNIDTENLITFNVDRWYPVNSKIQLWDTKFWDNMHLALIELFLIPLTLIYIVIQLINLKRTR